MMVRELRTVRGKAEVEAILAVAAPLDAAVILLAAHGGLRVSECLALRWDDVAPPR